VKRHLWLGYDDGEYTCGNCGRTIWLSDIPSQEDVTLEQAMRDEGVLEDCDLEKVRQVMES